MTKEEFIKLQLKNRAEEANMSEEELRSLNEARRRHSKKVKDEIITSHEMNKQNKEKNTDNNR